MRDGKIDVKKIYVAREIGAGKIDGAWEITDKETDGVKEIADEKFAERRVIVDTRA